MLASVHGWYLPGQFLAIQLLTTGKWVVGDHGDHCGAAKTELDRASAAAAAERRDLTITGNWDVALVWNNRKRV